MAKIGSQAHRTTFPNERCAGTVGAIDVNDILRPRALSAFIEEDQRSIPRNLLHARPVQPCKRTLLSLPADPSSHLEPPDVTRDQHAAVGCDITQRQNSWRLRHRPYSISWPPGPHRALTTFGRCRKPHL